MPHEKSTPTPSRSELLFADDTVRITRHSLLPGATTGVHTHECDYVVMPVHGGVVRVERGVESSEFMMSAGAPYSRESGVTHSLVNVSKSEIVFVELEYLSAPK